jgi:hypothetical protein
MGAMLHGSNGGAERERLRKRACALQGPAVIDEGVLL